MTSYDHLPPPIVNVAQGSNSLSANEDNWLLNVFNNRRMNRNDTDVMSNTSSKQNTSTQQNTSIIQNTSTKSNESFEDESSNMEDNQFEDDSKMISNKLYLTAMVRPLKLNSPNRLIQAYLDHCHLMNGRPGVNQALV